MRKLKSVIFLGRKPGASAALRYLVDRGIEIKAVVAPENEDYTPRLSETAKKMHTPILNEKRLYEWIAKGDRGVCNTDLVISYLFWNKIKHPLIALGKRGCINFHPAPLPDYKNRAGYNTAILEQRKNYGVSVHFVDSEEFDSGPIIKVLKFKIDPVDETAHSLEQKSQDKLLGLFKTTIDLFLSKKPIKSTKNTGGLYLTAKQLEAMKTVNAREDSLEEINRKIRAFFFPPYSGANIKIKGQKFTLVNAEVLRYISKFMGSKADI